MSTITLHRIPAKPSKAALIKVLGTLGKPSKMPGFTFGISATLCKVGAKLAQIPGSVCHDCYALKANYQYPSVKTAHEKRMAGLDNPHWAALMTKQIASTGDLYFRWHDSGDLQNFQHLLNIVTIAENLPNVNFWLPTREKGLVVQYMRAFGRFPKNLCVRLSSAMVDAKPLPGFENTSTVHSDGTGHGVECPAYRQGNKCGECRNCWNKDVKNVSYRKH